MVLAGHDLLSMPAPANRGPFTERFHGEVVPPVMILLSQAGDRSSLPGADGDGESSLGLQHAPGEGTDGWSVGIIQAHSEGRHVRIEGWCRAWKPGGDRR